MGMALSSVKKNDDTIDRLPDEILVDIISRVPYKSTCCCKCVSTRWRDLICHPDHREKMPQSLAGFFYKSYSLESSTRHFTNVSEEGEPLIDSSLSFLPKYESIEVLDCCNGLLLCRCWKSTVPRTRTLDYVVCNPATEKWVVMSANDWSSRADGARLGFEPAVSSHFRVFEFRYYVHLEDAYYSIYIYSSKTGVWSYNPFMDSTMSESDNGRYRVPTDSRTVFLRGTFYFSTSDCLVFVVDSEGNNWMGTPFRNWRAIPTPVSPYGPSTPDHIYASQGQLYLLRITTDRYGLFGHEGDSELSVWVLEGEKWTLKHSVSISAKKKKKGRKKHSISFQQLFGELYPSTGKYCYIISIHPEHDVVFMVSGPERALISYDMDSRELRFIRQLGRDCGETSFIPYVPLFSKSLADDH